MSPERRALSTRYTRSRTLTARLSTTSDAKPMMDTSSDRLSFHLPTTLTNRRRAPFSRLPRSITLRLLSNTMLLLPSSSTQILVPARAIPALTIKLTTNPPASAATTTRDPLLEVLEDLADSTSRDPVLVDLVDLHPMATTVQAVLPAGFPMKTNGRDSSRALTMEATTLDTEEDTSNSLCFSSFVPRNLVLLSSPRLSCAPRPRGIRRDSWVALLIFDTLSDAVCIAPTYSLAFALKRSRPSREISALS